MIGVKKSMKHQNPKLNKQLKSKKLMTITSGEMIVLKIQKWRLSLRKLNKLFNKLMMIGDP